MNRFIGSHINGNYIHIEGEEINHIRAKRVKVGDEIEVLVQKRIYVCKVGSIDKKKVLCHIVCEANYEIPRPYVHVYQCVPEDIKVMDEIVENLSQVGAYTLTPIISGRSFRRYDVVISKKDRWERIALANLKQCMRPTPLVVKDPIFIGEVSPKHSMNLLLDNFHKGVTIKDIYLEKVYEIGLVVGPEGGFTQEEVASLRDKGFTLLNLRPYILKSKFVASLVVGMVMNLS